MWPVMSVTLPFHIRPSVFTFHYICRFVWHTSPPPYQRHLLSIAHVFVSVGLCERDRERKNCVCSHFCYQFQARIWSKVQVRRWADNAPWLWFCSDHLLFMEKLVYLWIYRNAPTSPSSLRLWCRRLKKGGKSIYLRSLIFLNRYIKQPFIRLFM